VAGEQLNFDIFARLREDGFAKAGKAANAASDDVLGLAKRLDELSKKSATARVSLAGDKEALAQLDKLDLKLLTTGRRVVDPKITLDGAAKAQAEIAGLEVSLDKLGSKSADATASVGAGPGGLAGPAGMGALIGAGVALSPIIATVAVGVGGFGLAAAGAVAPILKASKATGGLTANMAKLNPEQQVLAKSILALGKQYDVFQKQLQPQVLAVFGKGIQLAGHLMRDVQPVATATGKALGSMLSAIDKEFQSGTWQNFFGFMARTAGPDIQLLTNNFTDFMKLLPGLLTDLQPVAMGILQLTDDILKLGTAAVKVADAEHKLSTEAHNSSGFFGELAHAAERAVGQFIPGIPAATGLAHAISKQADASSKAGKGISGVGSAAAAAQAPVFNLSTALNNLATSEQKNVDNLLTLQGGLDSWRQSLNAATKQLNSNSAGFKGNSDTVIANREALRQTTVQAEAFAESQDHVGGNIKLASKVIQDQIHWLEVHGGKSKFAAAEIRALRLEEAKLHDIRQQIKVSAQGFWQISGGGRSTGTHPVAARGMFISQGRPGVDDQLIMAQRNELVVPVPIVKAGLVDHLRGMIPGFDAGGVVGNYSGSVGGEAKWLARMDAATLRAVDVATAAATTAGIKSAQAAASGGGPGMPGPGGGAPSANAALARRLYPEWGSGREWSSWNALAMGESGWSNTARNPSSGAYGIPQALPPSKMGAAANPPQSNPTAQIRWMHGYIAGTPGYGDPINTYAKWLSRSPHWYARGGVVGGGKLPRHVDPQQAKWLDQLARDVKTLRSDEKHAQARRKVLNRGLAISELWFLTHPNVEKGGIGWNEHERSLRHARGMLRHFNRTESKKEANLEKKIALLRLLTHYPKGRIYGGQGVPAPPPADGGAGGAGGGDTGGGGAPAPAPSGPPPIPPPPMPDWMVSAGLGAGAGAPGGGFMFAPPPMAAPLAIGGGMGWADPVPMRFPGGGGRSMSGGGGFDLGALISAVQAMHQDVVGAVGRVAPNTARGFDQGLNSMTARVAGRFS
jgi:hypothetical protein